MIFVQLNVFLLLMVLTDMFLEAGSKTNSTENNERDSIQNIICDTTDLYTSDVKFASVSSRPSKIHVSTHVHIYLKF